MAFIAVGCKDRSDMILEIVNTFLGWQISSLQRTRLIGDNRTDRSVEKNLLRDRIIRFLPHATGFHGSPICSKGPVRGRGISSLPRWRTNMQFLVDVLEMNTDRFDADR